MQQAAEAGGVCTFFTASAVGVALFVQSRLQGNAPIGNRQSPIEIGNV
jgi:hypothetical protein